MRKRIYKKSIQQEREREKEKREKEGEGEGREKKGREKGKKRVERRVERIDKGDGRWNALLIYRGAGCIKKRKEE